jgi:hypothetical protein
MIVATIDLWPIGLERAKYPIGKVFITNDGGGTVETANYDLICEEYNRDGTLAATRRTKIKNFRRKNGALALLAEAVKSLNDVKETATEESEQCQHIHSEIIELARFIKPQ